MVYQPVGCVIFFVNTWIGATLLASYDETGSLRQQLEDMRRKAQEREGEVVQLRAQLGEFMKSRTNLKIVGCVVSAIAGGGMLVALIGGLSSNPVESEVSGTALAAMPFTSATGIGSTQPRLGGLRATIFHNPAMQGPLAKLAISALDVNNRLNHRDISMKART